MTVSGICVVGIEAGWPEGCAIGADADAAYCKAREGTEEAAVVACNGIVGLVAAAAADEV